MTVLSVERVIPGKLLRIFLDSFWIGGIFLGLSQSSRLSPAFSAEALFCTTPFLFVAIQCAPWAASWLLVSCFSRCVLPLAAFCRGIQLGIVYGLLQSVFGGIGWPIIFLILFTGLSSLPLLYFQWLRLLSNPPNGNLWILMLSLSVVITARYSSYRLVMPNLAFLIEGISL